MVDKFERLREAVMVEPDINKWMNAGDAYAGSGMDHAVARAFVEYRDSVVRVAKGLRFEDS